jgi:hypothetical protein
MTGWMMSEPQPQTVGLFELRVSETIRARAREIRALTRKRAKLVRDNNGPEAVKVQRQIDHLQRLNDEGRGRSSFTLPNQQGSRTYLW